MTRSFKVDQSTSLGYVQNVVCTTPTTPAVGDLVIVGDLVGYAMQDESADGYTVVDFGPKQLAGPVAAVGANIVVGTPLYAAVDTGVVVVNNTATGKFLGYALGAINSGSSATISFLKEPSITASTTLGTGAVSASEIADAAVTKSKLAGGFSKVTLKAGAAAGDIAVTGIAVGDELVSVIRIVDGADATVLSDITSEFTIAAGKINNTAGTNTTGNQLLVFWNDLTA